MAESSDVELSVAPVNVTGVAPVEVTGVADTVRTTESADTTPCADSSDGAKSLKRSLAEEDRSDPACQEPDGKVPKLEEGARCKDDAGSAPCDDKKEARIVRPPVRQWKKPRLPDRGHKDPRMNLPVQNKRLKIVSKRLKELFKPLRISREFRTGKVIDAVWCAEKELAEVTLTKGKLINTMGLTISSKHYLYVEEAVYLVDRGDVALTINEPTAHLTSLQEAFALMNRHKYPFHNYVVYAHLRRFGYIPIRPNYLSDVDQSAENSTTGSPPAATEGGDVASSTPEEDKSATWPTYDPEQTIRTDAEVWTRHAEVKATLKPLKMAPVPSASDSEVKSAFDVYLPDKAFRRSNPGKPSFRLFVFRYSDPVPRPTVLQSQSPDIPIKIAVVDAGTLLFFDAAGKPVKPGYVLTHKGKRSYGY